MFRFGPWEIAAILAVVLIVFGPKRLPELGRGIGQFIKNFKNSLAGKKDDSDHKDNDSSS